MGLEKCPECGHFTRVYGDQGNRKHYEGCNIGHEQKCPPESFERIEIAYEEEFDAAQELERLNPNA